MFDGNADSRLTKPERRRERECGQTLSEFLPGMLSPARRRAGMHLYLAAFEQAVKGSLEPDEGEGRTPSAWELACRSKGAVDAEYIFRAHGAVHGRWESMRCAEELQRLALDKLEEFGLSREDIEYGGDDLRHFLGLRLGVAVQVTNVSKGASLRRRPCASLPKARSAEACRRARGPMSRPSDSRWPRRP